jgi:hypothetical protein
MRAQGVARLRAGSLEVGERRPFIDPLRQQKHVAVSGEDELPRVEPIRAEHQTKRYGEWRSQQESQPANALAKDERTQTKT